MTADPAARPAWEWTGGAMSPRATCVLAPNPSPMTLEGTNTWILAEPGASRCAVLDPGPDDEVHLRRVLEIAEAAGYRVAMALLTHGHPDHAAGAERFAELTGVPVRALGTGRDDVREGEVLTVDGLELAAIHTPGHTHDCLCFVLPAENTLLTGDTILGWGTTVVAWPDGLLQEYLDSLHRLRDLTGSGSVTRILPGHGHVVEDAVERVAYYLAHRYERLDQIREAIAEGRAQGRDPGVEHVLARVYADAPENVWPAARQSIRAQLDYLGVTWTDG